MPRFCKERRCYDWLQPAPGRRGRLRLLALARCSDGAWTCPENRLHTDQPGGALKSIIIPQTCPSRYPSRPPTQWPQDKQPVLSASPPGNWLPLLPRSAPLSRPSALPALASQLPPRPLSRLASSRRAASRQLTLPAPRRPSTVSLGAIGCVDERELTVTAERADWPKEKLLVSWPSRWHHVISMDPRHS